ncbi:MAG: EAL domain-containing protein [Solirubrobacteraceae bacterium]|nr:EAL domain-containing protein [Patulibacter sp.]
MALLPARAFAAASGLALIAYFFLSPAAADYGYDAFGVASVAAILWSVARGRLTRGRTAWILFALANACWVVGDLLFNVVAKPGGEVPFPCVADCFYLLGYPFLAAAIVLAARLRGPRRDLLSVLDGVMVALAAAIPVYVLWIAPAVRGSGLSTFAQVISVAYPAMDLLVIVAMVRFGLGSGRWNVAAVLFAVGLVLSTISDVAYNVALLHESYAMPSPIDAGWLLAYALWGTAALHPSARTLMDAGQRKYGVSLRSRLWIVVAIVVMPLSVIAWSYVQGTNLSVGAVLVPIALIAFAMALRLRLLASRGTVAWRGPALLTAAGMMIIAVAIGLTELHASTQRQARTNAFLVEQLGSTEQIDTIAVRAAGGDAGSIVYLDGALIAAPSQLKAAEDDYSLAATPTERTRLIGLGQRYLRMLGAEAVLIHTGRWKAAVHLNETAVKQAHDDLVGATRALSAHYRVRADQNAKMGRIGTVVLLLLALLLLTGLLLRYGSATRAAQAVAERGKISAENERRFRALIGGSADILIVLDEDSVVLDHHETAEHVLGYDDGSLAGTRLVDLLEPEQASHTLAVLAALVGRDSAGDTIAWQLRRADGSVMEAEASIVNHVDDPLIGGFVVNVRDVTERKVLEAELEHRSFHDPLTGLANRGLLADRVRQAIGRSARDPQPHALLLLDIDDFKAVNDSLGHRMGDELVRQIAQRLSPYVRAHDTLARVGGDEFALLVEDLTADGDALGLAERLVEVLSEPVDLDGHPYTIHVSIGVAVADGSGAGSTGEQASMLLRNAELAMYEAKRSGGSTIEVFAARMHDAVTKRLELKAELELALQRDEFSLVYQPIVDVAQRRIAGYEALVRWIHPERGMVSPADFIPIAEQTGLIVDLGTWVLREACRQLAEWQPGWTEERYVSVNVAGQQLQRDDFGVQVRAALSASGLPPHQLLLEMTESSLIADTEGSERTINELRRLGVRLAIDDFGTGYSSLSYLHRFSVDVLKIDKAFIDNITVDGPGNALVDAIVNMAGSLQLKVVAEGIEEPEQVEALALMRCELGQGYHYSRPLPVGEVPAFELAPGPAAPPTLRIAS